MTAQEFAARIRAKYPGQYDGIQDKDLVDKVLIKHPQYKDQISDPNYRLPVQAEDWAPAGAEKPAEEKLAENAVEVGNSAGMAYAMPGMVKGAAGLGLKGLGAITEGLAPAAEDASNWFGSRVLNFSKGLLPKSATKAAEMVDDASDYAMNPHPEVQAAIRSMNAAPAAEDAALTGKELVPASEKLVKAGGAADEAIPTADALTGVDELGDPILSMSNLTTASQLGAAENHLGTVGKAIENTLKGLDETGNLYDPKPTEELLMSMYQRNASGSIIPAGSGSQQAIYNEAVSRAVETLKVKAMSDDGVLQKLSWEQANIIKKALSDLADYGLKDNDPVNMVYQQAARSVRDSIDDQATKILAAQGKDVANFQTLRDAYGKLKQVQSALNGKALSAMGAKNVMPVVRTSMAATGGVLGAMVGGPLGALAGAATPMVEWGAREFGPIMAARALKGASGLPAAAARTGADLTAASGGMSNAAKGVAAGLALDMNEAD